MQQPQKEFKQPRLLNDSVIVYVGTPFESEVFVRGVKGKGTKILTDPRFDPARSSKKSGIVVGAPNRFTKTWMFETVKQLPKPIPQFWHRWAKMNTYKDFEPIANVEVGDRVYFHFNAMQANHDMGNGYYRIPYPLLICTVKYYLHDMKTGKMFKKHQLTGNKSKAITDPEILDKEMAFTPYQEESKFEMAVDLQMVGEYCLVRPDHETWEDVKKYVPVMDANGKPMLGKDKKPLTKPLFVKAAPGQRYLVGFMEHIGKQFGDDPVPEIKKGERIMYYRGADWENLIEGDLYFVIKQRHIVGVMDADKHISE